MLQAVSDAWQARRDDVTQGAGELAEHVRSGARVRPSAEPLTEALLAEAQRNCAGAFDATWGGWGGAPKFPPGPTLEFLLRRGETELTRRTLDGMAAGGMYDLVGGGFHRYSVDERWLVPHFEKMLYDNALLAPGLRAGLAGARRRALPRRGGRDGRVRAARAGPRGRRLRVGPGRGHGRRRGPDVLVGAGRGRAGGAAAAVRARPVRAARRRSNPACRRELFAIREQRPKPLRDDKAIASWNGLMLAALAQCGLRARPARLARRRAARSPSSCSGRSRPPTAASTGRGARASAKGTGYLSDYADVAHGLIELHVATGELRWLLEAHRLAGLAVDLFGDDEGGGFFQAPRDGEQLMARKKELDDQPTPSGNAMLAYVLLRLGRIWGDDELEQRGVGVLRLVRDTVVRVPTAFGWMLVALDQYLAPRREWAIVGPPDAPVARAALALRAPTDVVAFGPAEASRCSPARRSSTVSLPCTPASASPAGCR